MLEIGTAAGSGHFIGSKGHAEGTPLVLVVTDTMSTKIAVTTISKIARAIWGNVDDQLGDDVDVDIDDVNIRLTLDEGTTDDGTMDRLIAGR